MWISLFHSYLHLVKTSFYTIIGWKAQIVRIVNSFENFKSQFSSVTTSSHLQTANKHTRQIPLLFWRWKVLYSYEIWFPAFKSTKSDPNSKERGSFLPLSRQPFPGENNIFMHLWVNHPQHPKCPLNWNSMKWKWSANKLQLCEIFFDKSRKYWLTWKL